MTLVVLAIWLSSCGGFDGMDDIGSSADYPVTVSASAGVASRIAVSGLEMSWEDDDVLKIAAVAADRSLATSELSVLETDPSDRAKASFTGFVTMLSRPQYCCFIYPSSEASSVDPETGLIRFRYNQQTGRHEPFMYDKVLYDENGMNASLSHVGAVLALTIDMDGVSEVTFVGNDNENISSVTVDPDAGKVSPTNEIGKEVTVPVRSDGKTYICVPPVNFRKGFTLKCSKPDGTSMIRTFSSDGSLGGGYDFSDKVGHIIPITLSGGFEAFSVSVTGLEASHTYSGSRLTGTAVTFRMTAAGVSDKIIEEWGADLYNSDDELVRSVTFTNASPAKGQTVTMEVANDWKLLPAGEYYLRPRYRMYGEAVTLTTQVVHLPDPGVWVKINGNTSYDKYLAGNVSGANAHTTTIEGLSISTNLDASLFSWTSSLEYNNPDYEEFESVKLENKSPSSLADKTEISFTDPSCPEYCAYEFKATLTVPKLAPFTASRTFHITGLPCTMDFTKGNIGLWQTLGADAKQTSDYVQFEGKFSEWDAAVMSPAYHIPADIPVYAYADVTSKKNSQTMYVGSCSASNSSISFGSSKIAISYNSGSFKSKGYVKADSPVILTASKPALIFAQTVPGWWLGTAVYKIKIEYK